MNEACGGAEPEATPLAAAVELLHNFSLVHDDIEDGSDTRRHRPTAWSLWGAPLTINMGDGMHALAHLALHQSSLRRSAPARFVEITQGFAQAALRLCEGQHLDMSFEQAPQVTVEQYLCMIGGKSATLIAAAAWMGAYAAGTAIEQAQYARRFGFELGMAFQMQDDILGIWGNEAVTGKSAVSDIASRKKTLPILLAMADPREGERLRALYSPAADAVETQEILAILDRTGAREQTAAFLRRHRDAGLEALRQMDLPTAMYEHLLSVARLFVDRAS
jgi:geranylgeranyl diphosphate synthase type I